MTNRKNEKKERFTLTLSPKLSKKLNNYCLGVATKLGFMPHAIKTKILRMALDEWLGQHGSDYDIRF